MSNTCVQNECFGAVKNESLINNEKSANEEILNRDVTKRFASSPSSAFSNDITYTAVTVTTEQLQDLYANGPLEILPPPGEGLMYIVHGCAMSIDEGGTTFNSDFQYSIMGLVYKADDNPFLCLIQGAFFLDYTANRTTYATGYIFNVDKTYVYTDSYVNKAVALYPYSEFDATGGTTRLRVHVWYTTIEATF
jgi:hypothetical protein